jgi:hypothetical protein
VRYDDIDDDEDDGVGDVGDQSTIFHPSSLSPLSLCSGVLFQAKKIASVRMSGFCWCDMLRHLDEATDNNNRKRLRVSMQLYQNVHLKACLHSKPIQQKCRQKWRMQIKMLKKLRQMSSLSIRQNSKTFQI